MPMRYVDIEHLKPFSLLGEVQPGNILYRIFDGTLDLIYIGMTGNLYQRMQGHRSNSVWWSEVAIISWEYYATRTILSRMERTAINRESPRYNIVRVPSLEDRQLAELNRRKALWANTIENFDSYTN